MISLQICHFQSFSLSRAQRKAFKMFKDFEGQRCRRSILARPRCQSSPSTASLVSAVLTGTGTRLQVFWGFQRQTNCFSLRKLHNTPASAAILRFGRIPYPMSSKVVQGRSSPWIANRFRWKLNMGSECSDRQDILGYLRTRIFLELKQSSKPLISQEGSGLTPGAPGRSSSCRPTESTMENGIAARHKSESEIKHCKAMTSQSAAPTTWVRGLSYLDSLGLSVSSLNSPLCQVAVSDSKSSSHFRSENGRKNAVLHKEHGRQKRRWNETYFYPILNCSYPCEQIRLSSWLLFSRSICRLWVKYWVASRSLGLQT